MDGVHTLMSLVDAGAEPVFAFYLGDQVVVKFNVVKSALRA